MIALNKTQKQNLANLGFFNPSSSCRILLKRIFGYDCFDSRKVSFDENGGFHIHPWVENHNYIAQDIAIKVSLLESNYITVRNAKHCRIVQEELLKIGFSALSFGSSIDDLALHGRQMYVSIDSVMNMWITLTCNTDCVISSDDIDKILFGEQAEKKVESDCVTFGSLKDKPKVEDKYNWVELNPPEKIRVITFKCGLVKELNDVTHGKCVEGTDFCDLSFGETKAFRYRPEDVLHIEVEH